MLRTFSNLGDAILTLWPVRDYKMIKATVQHVIQCTLSIQKNYGIYHTSVGVKLKVKLGKNFSFKLK